MPSYRTTVRGTAHRRRPHLGVEPLEPRLVAAGDVTARLVGTTLLLAGDAQANEINVASVADGSIAVLGADTTINGSATPFVTSSPVRHIVAWFAGGDDVVAFSNTSFGVASLRGFLTGFGSARPVVPQDAIDAVAAGATSFFLPGSITLVTGTGDDTVLIVGDVGGSVAVNLGPAHTTHVDHGNLFGVGWNAREPDGSLSESHIGGSLVVTGGTAADGIGLYAVAVGGSVWAALGSGMNSVEMALTRVQGGVAMTSSGGCGFRFNSSVVHGAVSLSLGNRGNDVVLSDRTSLVRAAVGSITITTGAGNDFVLVGDLDVRRGVQIASGAGADWIELGGRGLGPVVGGGVTIASGAGDDRVRVSSSRIGGTLTIALGGGNDFLSVRSTRALAIWLCGGPGVNTLALNAAAPRGIRLYRFQVMTG